VRVVVTDVIILIMEWIGTVAFAISGSIVAIRHRLDLFGVITVGCATAVGGGIFRDILIGDTPPKIFFNYKILLVAMLTSLAVFILAYVFRKNFKKISESVDTINVLFDALGLAAFSVTGVEIVCLSLHKDNFVFAIAMGVLTGVGGGVLRDVLVNEKPYILTKHVYAVVSIVSCSFYYLFSVFAGYKVFGTIFSLAFTVLMRILAAKLHWKLPKIELEGREGD
jgi:uncharacterized membrane protein YeiH